MQDKSEKNDTATIDDKTVDWLPILPLQPLLSLPPPPPPHNVFSVHFDSR